MAKKKTEKTIQKIDKFYRPPIVTVMGHVDHGKTTLLDAIRESRVWYKETGGMTQSIGAYQVKVKNKGKEEKLITFIDTPGHAAFTAMRARGAKVTDIVVLVVSADDGVKPQTIEAIDHAKAAGVPIIVAVNKIDLPGANVNLVKDQLAKHELLSEDWGGQTIFVEVSAKNKTNIDTLLEMILLLAEMQELTYEPADPFTGWVIESHLDSKRGPVASIVVKSGTLHQGDIIFVGEIEGKVKGMVDDRGQSVKEAKISSPVEILGLSAVVPVGGLVTAHEVEDEKIIVEEKKSLNLEELFAADQENKREELGLVIKAESQGTLEAVVQSIVKIPQDKIKITIIRAASGPVTDSDIMLAKVSHAQVLTFREKVNSEMISLAHEEEVIIQQFDVIYKLLEMVESFVSGEGLEKIKNKVICRAVVQTIFAGSNDKMIAGVKVLEGVLNKGRRVKLMRGEGIVVEGKVHSMKHLKETVNELKKGMEGGVVLDVVCDFEKGDELIISV